MKWVGPYMIRDLLENSIDYKHPWPPENNGIYIVSKYKWNKRPTADCYPLYVGGTTGKSNRFSTRVGDLIADLFGFFGEETGHHSGGQTLHQYCKDKNIKPLDLYLGWAEKCSCNRCAEIHVVQDLNPQKNGAKPSRCKAHKKNIYAV
jgi:hypothetical protein